MRGVALDSIHHRLFVTNAGSTGNNRVMVFNLDSNNDLIDRVADYVLGQPAFNTSSSAVTQSGMNQPQCVAYDNTNDRLFVCDSSNNRVLVFDVSSITNGMNASYVLGQSSFTTSSTAVSQSGTNSPRAAVYDANNNRLFVSDLNNRVLVYDVSTISSGQNAIYVLGQATFTSSTAATTQSGMNQAQIGLVYDHESNRLFVADVSNNRILVFDVTSSTMTNGMNASYVLGQSTFTSSTQATTQSGFITPRGLAYDSAQRILFVVDDQNYRVLTFDVATSSIANGMNATAVIGQINFTSSTIATTQTNFNRPFGAEYDSGNNRLYVCDVTNKRVMIFNFIRITSTSLANGTANASYSETANTTSSQGTVSFAVTSGSLPTGLTLSSAGTLSGTPTTTGTYTFSIQATDDNGAIGSFVSNIQSFSVTIAAAAATSVVTAGALPIEYFIKPAEPLIMTINGGASSTNSRYVALNLQAPNLLDGPNGKRVSISNNKFQGAAQLQPFANTIAWDLCATTDGGIFHPAQCPSGLYTISVEFYTGYNQRSAVYSANIIYDQGDLGAATTYLPSGVLDLSLATSTPPIVPTNKYQFPRNLKLGMKGDDVKLLQEFLNTHGVPLAQTGPGSPGSETTFFGSLTKRAVMQFQDARKNDILSRAGITTSMGFFGPVTRGYIGERY